MHANEDSDSMLMFPASAGAVRAEGRTHVQKSDDSLAVLGANGDIECGSEGLYYNDMRHLSRMVVRLDGVRLRLLSAGLSMDNQILVCHRAARVPDGQTDTADERNDVSLRVETFLWRDCRYDAVKITNWSQAPQTIPLNIEFDSDFADLFEIRGAARSRRGTLERALPSTHEARLAYRGLDGVRRWTSLDFDPMPDRLSTERACYHWILNPGEQLRIAIVVQCGAEAPGPRRRSVADARAAARRRRRDWRRQTASIATGNAVADAALCRARDDLLMLTTETEHGPYPYAGVPWFSTVFGRDALITALEVLWFAPGLARGVLAWLAANQADCTDAATDSEPGKILHESRSGEMARCGEVPFGRYYGSVDATPLFVMLAGAYHDRTRDSDFARGLWPHVEAALAWIDGAGDADGDGFVEYGRKSPGGLANQGWKDSGDSIFHADGTLALGSIALCEVQGYVFAAKKTAARLAVGLGFADRAATLAKEAEALRARFDAAFWDDEMQFFVLALDGEKRPCRVLASNAGHALFTGIALPERADAIAARLMSPEFFSGWGIRTLARGEARFNPMAYHNGSVWPHDNALIGIGLARYGRARDAARLFDALLAAAVATERDRLPELFCGFRRRHGFAPTAYPVACSPQAWAAGALPALLDACVGPANPGAVVLPASLARVELTPAPG